MQALNRAERRKAFVNFMLLFVVTVTLIVTAVFFSIQVPFSNNRQLRQELSVRDNERELAHTFQSEMIGALQLLKNLDSKEVQPEMVNAEIDVRINKMNALIKSSPDANNAFYLSVIEHLAVLKTTKNEIRVLNGREKNSAELKMEIEQLKNNLHQKDMQLLQYQQQMMQAQ